MPLRRRGTGRGWLNRGRRGESTRNDLPRPWAERMLRIPASCPAELSSVDAAVLPLLHTLGELDAGLLQVLLPKGTLGLLLFPLWGLRDESRKMKSKGRGDQRWLKVLGPLGTEIHTPSYLNQQPPKLIA